MKNSTIYAGLACAYLLNCFSAMSQGQPTPAPKPPPFPPIKWPPTRIIYEPPRDSIFPRILMRAPIPVPMVPKPPRYPIADMVKCMTERQNVGSHASCTRSLTHYFFRSIDVLDGFCTHVKSVIQSEKEEGHRTVSLKAVLDEANQAGGFLKQGKFKNARRKLQAISSKIHGITDLVSFDSCIQTWILCADGYDLLTKSDLTTALKKFKEDSASNGSSDCGAHVANLVGQALTYNRMLQEERSIDILGKALRMTDNPDAKSCIEIANGLTLASLRGFDDVVEKHLEEAISEATSANQLAMAHLVFAAAVYNIDRRKAWRLLNRAEEDCKKNSSDQAYSRDVLDNIKYYHRMWNDAMVNK